MSLTLTLTDPVDPFGLSTRPISQFDQVDRVKLNPHLALTEADSDKTILVTLSVSNTDGMTCLFRHFEANKRNDLKNE